MSKQVNVSDLLHLRYKPKRKEFKEVKPCPAFQLFDWIIWVPDSIFSCRFRKLKPRSVLCLSNYESLQILKKLRSCLAESTVIIAGEDTNLSNVLSIVEAIQPFCRNIYYEAKDIDHPRIKSFCMGFNIFYLKKVEFQIIEDLISVVSKTTWKKEGVLASWGGIWKHLDKQLEDRRTASQFVEKCTWIKREELDPISYWKRLAECKFLLAPEGQGVQAPKLSEAWLMRTVPIVTDTSCFRDLQKEGFPFLIINEWFELKPEVLEKFEIENANIDWEKVQYMLTLPYFQSRYLYDE